MRQYQMSNTVVTGEQDCNQLIFMPAGITSEVSRKHKQLENKWPPAIETSNSDREQFKIGA
jgi:hypothetical protein